MNYLKAFLSCIIIFIIIIIAILAIIYFSIPNRYNVLIIGSDQRGTERARSDVLMIFSMPRNPVKAPSLITIPRDTRVEVEDHGTQKITHAYVYGEADKNKDLGNVELTKKTVENFLDIPIHATIEVTFESFKEIVNLLGGVSLYGEEITDERALEIVRDRFRSGGDFARTDDQREIFAQLLDKVNNQENLEKIYNYFQTSRQARFRFAKVPTLGFGAISLITRGGDFEVGNIQEEVIQGHGESIYTEEFNADLYYWVPDEQKTKELVDKYLK